MSRWSCLRKRIQGKNGTGSESAKQTSLVLLRQEASAQELIRMDKRPESSGDASDQLIQD